MNKKTHMGTLGDGFYSLWTWCSSAGCAVLRGGCVCAWLAWSQAGRRWELRYKPLDGRAGAVLWSI